MNAQIFNMEANAERILKEKTYLGNGLCRFEQLGLIKYLIDKGKTKEEIYKLWRSTDLYIARVKQNRVEIQDFFNVAYIEAQGFKMQVGNWFRIYQSELDWINAMDTYRWVKEFLLTLLCVYKFFGKDWCLYDNRIRRFCFSATHSKRVNKKEMQEKLSKCNQTYSPYRIMVDSKGNSKFKMNCPKLKEEEFNYLLRDPRQVEELLPLIETYGVCGECGNKFEINSYTKNKELCKDCYEVKGGT